MRLIGQEVSARRLHVRVIFLIALEASAAWHWGNGWPGLHLAKVTSLQQRPFFKSASPLQPPKFVYKIHSHPILIFNLLDHRSAPQTNHVDTHWSPHFALFCRPDVSVVPLCLQHATHYYTRVEHLPEGCCCRHADGESLDQS